MFSSSSSALVVTAPAILIALIPLSFLAFLLSAIRPPHANHRILRSVACSVGFIIGASAIVRVIGAVAYSGRAPAISLRVSGLVLELLGRFLASLAAISLLHPRIYAHVPTITTHQRPLTSSFLPHFTSVTSLQPDVYVFPLSFMALALVAFLSAASVISLLEILSLRVIALRPIPVFLGSTLELVTSFTSLFIHLFVLKRRGILLRDGPALFMISQSLYALVYVFALIEVTTHTISSGIWELIRCIFLLGWILTLMLFFAYDSSIPHSSRSLPPTNATSSLESSIMPTDMTSIKPKYKIFPSFISKPFPSARPPSLLSQSTSKPLPVPRQQEDKRDELLTISHPYAASRDASSSRSHHWIVTPQPPSQAPSIPKRSFDSMSTMSPLIQYPPPAARHSPSTLLPRRIPNSQKRAFISRIGKQKKTSGVAIVSANVREEKEAPPVPEAPVRTNSNDQHVHSPIPAAAIPKSPSDDFLVDLQGDPFASTPSSPVITQSTALDAPPPPSPPSPARKFAFSPSQTVSRITESLAPSAWDIHPPRRPKFASRSTGSLGSPIPTLGNLAQTIYSHEPLGIGLMAGDVSAAQKTNRENKFKLRKGAKKEKKGKLVPRRVASDSILASGAKGKQEDEEEDDLHWMATLVQHALESSPEFLPVTDAGNGMDVEKPQVDPASLGLGIPIISPSEFSSFPPTSNSHSDSTHTPPMSPRITLRKSLSTSPANLQLRSDRTLSSISSRRQSTNHHARMTSISAASRSIPHPNSPLLGPMRHASLHSKSKSVSHVSSLLSFHPSSTSVRPMSTIGITDASPTVSASALSTVESVNSESIGEEEKDNTKAKRRPPMLNLDILPSFNSSNAIVTSDTPLVLSASHLSANTSYSDGDRTIQPPSLLRMSSFGIRAPVEDSVPFTPSTAEYSLDKDSRDEVAGDVSMTTTTASMSAPKLGSSGYLGLDGNLLIPPGSSSAVSMQTFGGERVGDATADGSLGVVQTDASSRVESSNLAFSARSRSSVSSAGSGGWRRRLSVSLRGRHPSLRASKPPVLGSPSFSSYAGQTSSETSYHRQSHNLRPVSFASAISGTIEQSTTLTVSTPILGAGEAISPALTSSRPSTYFSLSTASPLTPEYSEHEDLTSGSDSNSSSVASSPVVATPRTAGPLALSPIISTHTPLLSSHQHAPSLSLASPHQSSLPSHGRTTAVPKHVWSFPQKRHQNQNQNTSPPPSTPPLPSSPSLSVTVSGNLNTGSARTLGSPFRGIRKRLDSLRAVAKRKSTDDIVGRVMEKKKGGEKKDKSRRLNTAESGRSTWAFEMQEFGVLSPDGEDRSFGVEEVQEGSGEARRRGLDLLNAIDSSANVQFPTPATMHHGGNDEENHDDEHPLHREVPEWVSWS